MTFAFRLSKLAGAAALALSQPALGGYLPQPSQHQACPAGKVVVELQPAELIFKQPVDIDLYCPFNTKIPIDDDVTLTVTDAPKTVVTQVTVTKKSRTTFTKTRTLAPPLWHGPWHTTTAIGCGRCHGPITIPPYPGGNHGTIIYPPRPGGGKPSFTGPYVTTTLDCECGGQEDVTVTLPPSGHWGNPGTVIVIPSTTEDVFTEPYTTITGEPWEETTLTRSLPPGDEDSTGTVIVLEPSGDGGPSETGDYAESEEPAEQSTGGSTGEPTGEPIEEPTDEPTGEPTEEPTQEPIAPVESCPEVPDECTVLVELNGIPLLGGLSACINALELLDFVGVTVTCLLDLDLTALGASVVDCISRELEAECDEEPIETEDPIAEPTSEPTEEPTTPAESCPKVPDECTVLVELNGIPLLGGLSACINALELLDFVGVTVTCLLDLDLTAVGASVVDCVGRELEAECDEGPAESEEPIEEPAETEEPTEGPVETKEPTEELCPDVPDECTALIELNGIPLLGGLSVCINALELLDFVSVTVTCLLDLDLTAIGASVVDCISRELEAECDEEPTETEKPTEEPAEPEQPTEEPAETEEPTEGPVETEEPTEELCSEVPEECTALVELNGLPLLGGVSACINALELLDFVGVTVTCLLDLVLNAVGVDVVDCITREVEAECNE